MWRCLLASLLLSAFIIQTFSTNFLIASFYANQKYIAANLCVNKDRPGMKCCGKCQLTKKISREENKDKQNAGNKSDNKEEIIFSTSFFSPVGLSATGKKNFYSFNDKNFFPPYLYTFFRPPRIV
jgi:hypothetical protein